MAQILIIKLGALGDVVMATPLMDAIMRHHRADQVTLLTTPPFAALFAAWPALEVHTSPRRGAGAMMRLLRWLRERGFDRIYDLQGSNRSAWLCRLGGAQECIGNHARRPYTHHPTMPWRGETHIHARMKAVLASGGVHGVKDRPWLPASDAIVTRVSRWLADHTRVDDTLVLLHAGASPKRPAKRWPGFGELAERLRHLGLRVVWLGAGNDRELNAGFATAEDVDATGAFDILELAELGRRAQFAVTNDSGPMHVLAASGIPVYGVFGPSDWRRNHALGQAGRVIACVDFVEGFAGARCADCLPALGVEAVYARLVDDGVIPLASSSRL